MKDAKIDIHVWNGNQAELQLVFLAEMQHCGQSYFWIVELELFISSNNSFSDSVTVLRQ